MPDQKEERINKSGGNNRKKTIKISNKINQPLKDVEGQHSDTT